MARTEPFDNYMADYEAWFSNHRHVYFSEVEAIRHFIPEGKKGVEIGIGTGRFAVPLNIRVGVDPSGVMGDVARKQGIQVFDGIAEALPFNAQTFDFALMVTTVCFVDDVIKAFEEANRVLKPRGYFIVGMVDGNSTLGKVYRQLKDRNKFYRVATFYGVGEVIGFLHRTGFGEVKAVQTIFGDIDSINEIQPYEPGYGKGGFVVLRATKLVENDV